MKMTFYFLVHVIFIYIFENCYRNDRNINLDYMKKIYLLLLCAFALNSATAQTNLALTATCTHSGGGGGAYGPAEYNNGSISVAPNTPWGWTNFNQANTNGYIEFDFGSSTKFNVIKLYHVSLTTRCMSQADIQIWNGSTWVKWEGYNMSSNPQLVYTYEFDKVATSTKMRIGGTVVFTGGQTSNSNFREIEIFYEPTAPVNAGVESVTPLSACTVTQDISARVGNYGSLRLDSFDINWSLNGTAQTSITYNNSPYSLDDTLTADADTLITLKTGHVFTPFTDYEIKVWTSDPNGMADTVPDDDTVVYKMTFYGEPMAPTGGSFSFCGIGQKPVSATPAASGDSIFWFTEKTGGGNFAIGQSVNTPFMYNTDTFYVASYRLPAADTADNGLVVNFVGYSLATNDNEGGMINVTAGSADVILTQLSFSVNNATLTDYSLYTRPGSFVGFETSSAGWTRIDTGQSNTVTHGIQEMIDIPVTMVIPAGTTQAFYFNCLNNNINISAGDVGLDEPFVSTDGNQILLGLYGATGDLTGYTVGHEITYHSPSCSNASARVEVPVEILPLPIGASLEEGTPFNGTYASGTLSDPDIVAANDEIVYELKNPTLFPNADYGTTWEISDTSLTTKFGTEVNMGTMVTTGSTTGPTKFSFTPDSTMIAFTDSTLKLALTLKNIATGCDTVVERCIFVAPRVDPGFSVPASLCEGDPVSFINTSTISSGGVLYHWDFGVTPDTDDTSVAPNTSYTFAKAGTYTVRLRTTSTPYGYVTDTSATVVVQETPVADFTRENACSGFDVLLTNATSYGGSGTVVYDWDFGDGSAHSTQMNETKQYSPPGSYDVTLTSDVGGCFSKKTKTVYQFAKPVVDFTVPSSSVCNYTEVDFSNASSIANGTMGAFWSYGDNTTSNLKDGSHTYGSASTFDVKLKMISEFGCTDSLTKQISIKEGSKADFNFDNACLQNKMNVNFTGQAPSGQAPSILWTFGSEGQDGGTTSSHQWQSAGTKMVTVKVILNNGCNDSITKSVIVSDQPKVDFTFSGMCSDDEVVFQNGSTVGTGIMNFEWDFTDGGTSTKASPKHKFTAGTYDVKLKASIDQGCSDSITKEVVISANPNCNFVIADEYVNGHRGFRFTPTEGSLPFYRWTFGEGGTSDDENPLYQYLNDGSYTVTLFARNAAGCECELTQTHGVSDVVSIEDEELAGVSVYPNPTTGALTIELPTEGESYTLEVMNVIGKVLSTKTITNTSGLAHLNISGNATGLYLVKIKNNNKSKTVKVNLLK